ncbi:PIR protein CIR protein [Plasmodium vinckei lentum]|uniref:PIR protein CIR protein n=1 Tax=Plasmodium vinckei lentum TaxID=138297 RepID=A0A6V7SEW9_PLAVN|nr:PIR protein CIR protein [Plasmodium vinckei lentum]
MDDKTCDVLSEVDDLFAKGTVNVIKFNKFTKCHSYCPYQNKCTNDYERINALGSYLFNKISEIDKNFKGSTGDKRHIEVFMIWLGDKLFKIENDYKVTLEEYYKKHLEKFMGNFNYWEAIDSKKLYKKATIKKMSEFYNLLNYICKLIIEYNKNPQKPDSKRLGSHSTQCINFYRAIHISANECGPYLKLLDSLKMIYEIFRMQKIVNNYSINGKEKDLIIRRVKNLTTLKEENRYLLTVNATPSFDDKECIEAKSKDEKIGEQIILKKSQNKLKGTGPTKKPGTEPQKKSLPSTPQRKPPLPASAKPPVPKIPERPPAKPAPAQTAGVKSPQQPQIPTQKKEQSSPTTTVQQPPSAVPPVLPSKNDPSLQIPQKSEASHKSGTKDSDINKGSKGGGSNVLGGGISQPGNSGGKPKGDAQKKPNQVGNSSPGSKVSSQPTGVRNQGSGVGGQGKSSDKTDGGTGGQGKLSDKTGGGAGGQGGSGSQTKDSGNPPHGNTVTAPSGTGTPPPSDKTPPSGTTQSPVQPSPSLQPTDPPPVPSQKPEPPLLPQQSTSPTTPQSSDPQKPGSPPVVPPESQQPKPPVPVPVSPPPPPQPPSSQNDPPLQKSQTGGSSSGNGNPGGGSSDPTSSTAGGSFDFGSSILKFLLNGTENLKKTSEFIEQNQKIFKDAKDKISGAYNDTVENLKSAYNASSSYISEFINNVTTQLNQVGSPSNSDGSQPGSSNPSTGGNSSNQLPPPLPSTPKDPQPPPKDPQPPPKLPPPPATPTAPSIDPQKITPPALPPNPMPNATQDPSKVSLQQSQSLLQSQPITQKPSQINSSNQQKIVQFVKSLSSDIILKKPWNIFPTTWNGSGDCKPEIKFMNTTLVCCTSEQCSLTGISVTFVLIPIILLIVYKYLSFGSSKKSEKKNMKRVINFHDGKSNTKIIISSNDRSKHLKSVINSVGGKKNSLSNIYKLIRADPMPFINLFFLLIFFVYKRKRNTIE